MWALESLDGDVCPVWRTVRANQKTPECAGEVENMKRGSIHCMLNMLLEFASERWCLAGFKEHRADCRLVQRVSEQRVDDE